MVLLRLQNKNVQTHISVHISGTLGDIFDVWLSFYLYQGGRSDRKSSGWGTPCFENISFIPIFSSYLAILKSEKIVQASTWKFWKWKCSRQVFKVKSDSGKQCQALKNWRLVESSMAEKYSHLVHFLLAHLLCCSIADLHQILPVIFSLSKYD